MRCYGSIEISGLTIGWRSIKFISLSRMFWLFKIRWPPDVKEFYLFIGFISLDLRFFRFMVSIPLLWPAFSVDRLIVVLPSSWS